MINTPPKHLENSDKTEQHPALQLILFVVILFGALILGFVISFGIDALLFGMRTANAVTKLDLTAPHFAAALWITQLAGTTAPLVAAPLFFAHYLTPRPAIYLKTGPKTYWGLAVLIFVLMVVSNPLIEVLSNLNAKMFFNNWLHDMDVNAQKLMEVMIQMHNVWGVIQNVILIGLFTAIVEELCFRGVIQTIFVRWTKNIHAAVWITAILFSAFHMEFTGFLPRVLLGVLFGYFVAWSGSVWSSVWAHFINNGSIVVLTYLFQEKILTGDPNDQHIYNNTIYIISFVVTILLMLIYRRIALKKLEVLHYRSMVLTKEEDPDL